MAQKQPASTPARQRGRPRGGGDPTGTIQTLDRALDVLEMLSGSSGLTLTEISAELEQSPSTIYRVLTTLEGRRMVEAEPLSQTWHIGAGAFGVGSAFLRRSNIVERSRPFMQILMEQTGETSNLGIERDGSVVFVSQVETHQSIRAFFPPGTRSHLHVSGIGKALLSGLAPERLERLLSRMELPGFTPNTITDRAALRQELELTRARGYAVDNEEHTSGMRCIAAPIRNHHDEAIAGISVSGPAHRISETRIAEIGALAARAAQDLSRGLGAL